jgi:hypothetical protein
MASAKDRVPRGKVCGPIDPRESLVVSGTRGISLILHGRRSLQQA